MRYFVAMSITVLLVAFLAALPHSARSADNGTAAEKRDVKVSLAVVEGSMSTQSAFHVIIENISEKPQSHFVERYSWGYDNLTLQWTDPQGRTGTVSKVPGSFDKNLPESVVIQSGEAIVRDISFDPKVWTGWPAIANQTTLRVKVTYRSTGEPKTAGAGGWTGIVTSKEQTVVVWQPMASAAVPAPSK